MQDITYVPQKYNAGGDSPVSIAPPPPKAVQSSGNPNSGTLLREGCTTKALKAAKFFANNFWFTTNRLKQRLRSRSAVIMVEAIALEAVELAYTLLLAAVVECTLLAAAIIWVYIFWIWIFL